MSTNRSKANAEEILNALLVEIVLANTGAITGNDKNTLIQDWLSAIKG